MTKLQKAVIDQLGDKDMLKDVANHGAQGGFPGFTYYKDTCEFYDENESEIWEKLNDTAEAMGNKNTLELVASFGGADQVTDTDTFKNLLAWFALEDTAHELTD